MYCLSLEIMQNYGESGNTLLNHYFYTIVN